MDKRSHQEMRVKPFCHATGYSQPILTILLTRHLLEVVFDKTRTLRSLYMRHSFACRSKDDLCILFATRN